MPSKETGAQWLEYNINKNCITSYVITWSLLLSTSWGMQTIQQKMPAIPPAKRVFTTPTCSSNCYSLLVSSLKEIKIYTDGIGHVPLNTWKQILVPEFLNMCKMIYSVNRTSNFWYEVIVGEIDQHISFIQSTLKWPSLLW